MDDELGLFLFGIVVGILAFLAADTSGIIYDNIEHQAILNAIEVCDGTDNILYINTDSNDSVKCLNGKQFKLSDKKLFAK